MLEIPPWQTHWSLCLIKLITLLFLMVSQAWSAGSPVNAYIYNWTFATPIYGKGTPVIVQIIGSATPTPTYTGTASYTFTPIYTSTNTYTPTNTLPAGTNTYTPVNTATSTNTFTSTNTYTPTPTYTSTSTPTFTPTTNIGNVNVTNFPLQFTQVPQFTQLPYATQCSVPVYATGTWVINVGNWTYSTNTPTPTPTPTGSATPTPTSTTNIGNVNVTNQFTQIPYPSMIPTIQNIADSVGNTLSSTGHSLWTNVTNWATPMPTAQVQIVGTVTVNTVPQATPLAYIVDGVGNTISTTGHSLWVAQQYPVTIGAGAQPIGSVTVIGGPVTIGASTITGALPAGTNLLGYIASYYTSANKSVSATGYASTILGTYPFTYCMMGVTTIGGTGAVTMSIYSNVNPTYSGFVSLGSVTITGASAVSSFAVTTGPCLDYAVSVSGIAASTTITTFIGGMH